ncbi:hypothetical protein ACFXKG_00070 [Streptomyces sp. NPDC059255]|uniref:hypothetical protein n=1 Tax=Streptomyces sp. NPDC059255 TaxID=3346793 RepID=UPI00369EBBD7
MKDAKDVMIRVPDTVRDRLAVLAESRSISIRALLQEFAESTLTPEEREERAAEARQYISEHFGVLVSDADETALQRKIDATFHRAYAGGTAETTEPAGAAGTNGGAATNGGARTNGAAGAAGANGAAGTAETNEIQDAA